MKTWLSESTPSASRYWLTGHLAFEAGLKTVVENTTLQAALSDATVLFTGAVFKQVMAMSPRLVTAELASQLPDNILVQGIGLESQATYPEVVAHLHSLLLAALDGEEVLFRFYDPQVLLPMLAVMRPDEIDQLLGNLDQLTGMQDTGPIFYHNSDHHSGSVPLTQHSLTEHTETWWKIQPHHLKPLYRTDIHAHSLERYWWEKIPRVMNIPDDPYAVILQALDQAQQQGDTEDEAELWALSTLAQTTRTPVDELAQGFDLTSEERNTLYLMSKEHPMNKERQE